MKHKNPTALLTAGLALALAPAHAASVEAGATGTIIGQVSNAATRVNLDGALVRLDETNFSTRTERGGSYRLQVPPGNYTLVVNYTGLESQSISISVPTGGTITRDFEMTSDIYVMGRFTVAGEREGNALAITMQRQAPNVKNIVSADAYGALAGNPADLLVRLPGVIGSPAGGDIRYLTIRGISEELNTVTLDGNRMSSATSGGGSSRKYEFQQVGSDTIERFEVVKSPTPDMDGDSIGGAVNMVSKSAFDRSPARRLILSVGGIWRALDDRDNLPRPTFSLSYSEVFKGKLGVSLDYGYRRYLSALDQTQESHQATAAEPHFINLLSLVDFFSLRYGSGGGAKLDYKLSDNSRFSVSVSRTEQNEAGYQSTFQPSTSATVATRDASGNLTGTGTILPEFTNQVTEWRPITGSNVFLSARSHIRNGLGYHAEFNGVHRWDGGLDVDYSMYLSTTTQRYPGTNVFGITASGIGMRLTQTSQPAFPNFTQTGGPSMFDARSYHQNLLTTTSTVGVDRFEGLSFNAKRKFHSPVPTYIKTGFRIRRQANKLDNYSRQHNYLGPTGNMATADLSPFVRPRNENTVALNGRYPQMISLPFPVWPFRSGGTAPGYTGYNIGTALQEHPEHFQQDFTYTISQNLGQRQNFTETISAAYIMAGTELGKLNILGGLRVEQTKDEGVGAVNRITPAEQAIRNAFVGPVTETELRRRLTAQYSNITRVTSKHETVLPGVHFRYEPRNGMNLRASWATNIGRPSIGQMIPRTTVSDLNRTVTFTNPGLKPQFANNFDLAAEYYFEPVGLISAGFFLKEISNYIYTQAQVVATGAANGFDGEYAGYSMTSQANGGNARVRGFELAYQQQFTFLPGWLKGFGAFANYTRLETRTNYVGSVSRSTTEVAGFIPKTGNFGISYIRDKVTVRTQFNYRSRYLASFNANPALLLYFRDRVWLNVKTIYNLSRRFDVYLNVNNINATPDLYQFYTNNRFLIIQKLGPQFLFGINARL